MATMTEDDMPSPPPLVSDEEIAHCVAILERFHTESGLVAYQEPRYKPLRKAVMPLVSELRKKFFHGQSVDDDTQRQEKKRKLKIERARQKALDQQFINNTKLRADRLARLTQLTEENPLLAQVPDGVSSSDHLLTAHGEQETKTEADETTAVMDGAELHHHRACYTCKTKFRQLHHFYDRLCPSCAALNFKKRLQTADLRDHVAIVTGARVKIGYEIALKLLRSGAIVVATTRFPKDAAYRYAKEADFAEWKDRLQVYGLDFRDLGVIDKFMDHVEQTFGRADILINNATQTIRRPVHYYKHLLEAEVAPVPEEFAPARALLQGNAKLLGLENGEAASTESNAPASAIVPAVRAPSQELATAAAVPSSVLLSQVVMVPEDQEDVETAALFPQGQVDNNKQQVDLRKRNTWVQKIDEIETMELVEVFAINTMAPFILNKRVIPLLEKSKNAQKFIINVSAMEGKFYRAKTPNHPHTNMAKAAVNMMTRTCAEDLAKQGIYMNSVDTGWINDENPREVAARIAMSHNFQTPLDEVDAAARVLDPIFVLHQSDNKEPPLVGQFLKDYKVSEW
ncbi:hypothetical protein Poli38472_004058 [Pythium oligandrum]|uniref:Oxidoreductase n=1 Tax=Pythium oligandrum TaxID=41045 RepID=A0A8K1CQ20_PYTOL|nr:hypothetical protein Poli38472_004058 [Pythium oligandrum]|eukprot:TMW66293.1 hypothetical protein Poli38472_004058 [Pythium oligandrum]